MKKMYAVLLPESNAINVRNKKGFLSIDAIKKSLTNLVTTEENFTVFAKKADAIKAAKDGIDATATKQMPIFEVEVKDKDKLTDATVELNDSSKEIKASETTAKNLKFGDVLLAHVDSKQFKDAVKLTLVKKSKKKADSDEEAGSSADEDATDSNDEDASASASDSNEEDATDSNDEDVKKKKKKKAAASDSDSSSDKSDVESSDSEDDVKGKKKKSKKAVVNSYFDMDTLKKAAPYAAAISAGVGFLWAGLAPAAITGTAKFLASMGFANAGHSLLTAAVGTAGVTLAAQGIAALAVVGLSLAAIKGGEYLLRKFHLVETAEKKLVPNAHLPTRKVWFESRTGARMAKRDELLVELMHKIPAAGAKTTDKLIKKLNSLYEVAPSAKFKSNADDAHLAKKQPKTTQFDVLKQEVVWLRDIKALETKQERKDAEKALLKTIDAEIKTVKKIAKKASA